MVGLGETRPELHQTFVDLRAVDCDILTLGQYLRPSPEHLRSSATTTPTSSPRCATRRWRWAFAHVESGPLVRSSYHARDQVPDAEARRAERAERAAGVLASSPASEEVVRRGPTIDAEGQIIYRLD